jgi:hypothetical protein
MRYLILVISTRVANDGSQPPDRASRRNTHERAAGESQFGPQQAGIGRGSRLGPLGPGGGLYSPEAPTAAQSTATQKQRSSDKTIENKREITVEKLLNQC